MSLGRLMSSTFDQDPDEQRFPEEEQLCIEIRFARERSLNTFAIFDFVNKCLITLLNVIIIIIIK